MPLASRVDAAAAARPGRAAVDVLFLHGPQRRMQRIGQRSPSCLEGVRAARVLARISVRARARTRTCLCLILSCLRARASVISRVAVSTRSRRSDRRLGRPAIKTFGRATINRRVRYGEPRLPASRRPAIGCQRIRRKGCELPSLHAA